MPTYNPNDFYPHAGQEIKSDGTTVNPADSVDSNGNQGVSLNARGTSYQRILVNQTINASGSISTVLNVGMGTKSINLTYKTTGIAYMTIYPCDANGNTLTSGSTIANSSSTGYTTNFVIISELGGAPYIAIFVADKSAATNTCQFVDVFWTKS